MSRKSAKVTALGRMPTLLQEPSLQLSQMRPPPLVIRMEILADPLILHIMPLFFAAG